MELVSLINQAITDRAAGVSTAVISKLNNYKDFYFTHLLLRPAYRRQVLRGGNKNPKEDI